ncbi:MAG: tRNA (guanine-N1)-methyltransferase [Bacteroidota bacterium]
MKLKSTLLIALMAICANPIFAQENTNTLENQFVDVIEKSNRYQDYKVVKIFKLNNLRKNVNDTIAAIEKNLEAAQSTIAQQKSEIGALSQNVSTLEADLATSKGKEDGIMLFGSLIKKSTYKTTMWAIIGLLGLVVFFLLYKFRNSNAITKEANLKLAETEAEFEEHRQKNLEQQQVLRRKLQDEINKNRKV